MKDTTAIALAQIEAVSEILYQSQGYFYRKVCRWYSSTFHTPINQVYSIPYDEILTHYYEYHYEKLPYNEVLRIAKELLPDISQEKEQEDQEFLKQLIESEKAKKQSLNKDSKENAKPPSQPEPPEVFKSFDIEDEP